MRVYACELIIYSSNSVTFQEDAVSSFRDNAREMKSTLYLFPFILIFNIYKYMILYNTFNSQMYFAIKVIRAFYLDDISGLLDNHIKHNNKFSAKIKVQRFHRKIKFDS